MTPPAHSADVASARAAALRRVRRNFWSLTAATVLAVGVLSDALAGPAGAVSAVLVALRGVAAVVSVTLAGRILVVTSRHERKRAGRHSNRWNT